MRSISFLWLQPFIQTLLNALHSSDVQVRLLRTALIMILQFSYTYYHSLANRQVENIGQTVVGSKFTSPRCSRVKIPLSQRSRPLVTYLPPRHKETACPPPSCPPSRCLPPLPVRTWQTREDEMLSPLLRVLLRLRLSLVFCPYRAAFTCSVEAASSKHPRRKNAS